MGVSQNFCCCHRITREMRQDALVWQRQIPVASRTERMHGSVMKGMRDAREHCQRRTGLSIRVSAVLVVAALLLFAPSGKAQVMNAGFDAVAPDQSWQVDPEEAKQSYTINADKKDFKEWRELLFVS